jgi:hypothetical protein
MERESNDLRATSQWNNLLDNRKAGEYHAAHESENG